ncbi:MAG: filamentous hemagglutinin N-terminal domain-containing protein [Cyanobacteria bacterium J06627_8]
MHLWSISLLSPASLRVLLAGICGAGLVIADKSNEPAQAQVRADSTLPTNSRVVRDGDRFVITNGTQTGTNLFHSFQSFSVPENGAASFQNIDSGIEHIISRVTGSRVSNIEGLIQALGTDGRVSSADFFFINPNGIVFGPKASLNIGGSFIASTAEVIDFADGTQFRADGTQSSSLLTVSVPTGLQLGQQSGSIINRSFTRLRDANGTIVPDPLSPEDPFFVGLQVPESNGIALVGSPVFLDGGILTALSGRVELGSVQSGRVGLTRIEQGWRLSYPSDVVFGDITLDFAILAVDGSTEDTALSGNIGGTPAFPLNQAGSVQLAGDSIRLIRSAILANSFDPILPGSLDQNGRRIVIRSSDLFLSDSTIEATTFGNGDAGDFLIVGDRLTLRNGSQISSSTLGSGNGGTITLRINDSIDVAGGIFEITDEGQIDWFPSGVFTRVIDGASGNGGQLNITTDTLRIRNGGQIDAVSAGTGTAGSIQLFAPDIDISGVALNTDGSLFINSNDGFPRRSGIFNTALNQGDANQVDIRTERLSIRDGGVIQAGTFGDGSGSNLSIQATESVEIIGTDRDGRVPSSILATSGGIPGTEFIGFPNTTGQAGNITVQAPLVRVADRGAIAVGSVNPEVDVEDAGSITIQNTDQLLLSNQGQILAQTATGDGGNIILSLNDILALRTGGQISTTAGFDGIGGDGGNITITSPFIIAVAEENSDIAADAFLGRGGRVSITASGGVFGIEPQPTATPFSDITASSSIGLNGEIIINTPDVDPSRATVELPLSLVDASQLIVQGCSVSRQFAQQNQGVFVDVGRGGIAPSPTSILGSGDVVDDLTVPSTWDTVTQESNDSSAHSSIEAQGWIRDTAGDITLVNEISPVEITSGCLH